MRLLIGSLLVTVVSALWPVPIVYSEGNDTVVLTKGFSIQFNGPSGSLGAAGVDTSSKVKSAINLTYGLLNDGFVPKMLYTFEEDFEPSDQAMTSAQTLSTLIVTQKYSPLILADVVRSILR
jgi:hypothetical protein